MILEYNSMSLFGYSICMWHLKLCISFVWKYENVIKLLLLHATCRKFEILLLQWPEYLNGSTWVKIDTRNSATRPFLSREFSTRCLLSSDGHFHKIKFILRHATFWKRNKNDMRHFNINMIWHPTPQITYDATPDRAQLCLIPQCINSYQLNKIPSCCTMYVSKAFVMERLCCTTHRPSSECVVVPCSYTSLCVNRKECKQHLYSIRVLCPLVPFSWRGCLNGYYWGVDGLNKNLKISRT